MPLAIQLSAKAIIKAESALKLYQLEAEAGKWEGEELLVSKHAENLEQLDGGVKIPPSGWKCEKCDLKNNLWLNLTDGSILCGRKQWDGSGGNNHALEHYAVNKYPLVRMREISLQFEHDCQICSLLIRLSSWAP